VESAHRSSLKAQDTTVVTLTHVPVLFVESSYSKSYENKYHQRVSHQERGRKRRIMTSTKSVFYNYVKNSSKFHGHRIQYSKTDAGYLYIYKCVRIPYSYLWNDSDIPQWAANWMLLMTTF
jgi:hypothetical protein